MGVLDKCCGNCARSYGKDMDGYCACGVDDHFTSCDEVCDNHILSINGWTEITQDNEEEVYNLEPDRIVIANIVNGLIFYTPLFDMLIPISIMAKSGGYYYYELPELKIKEVCD